MKRYLTTALLGVVALGGIAVSAPAGAMPASPLPAVSSLASAVPPSVESVRWRRPVFRGRGYGHRGYRRGGPIRRLLRRL